MATWQLDPNVLHLNHGSFGAAPVEVLAEQTRWRDLMESNPDSFMLEIYQLALEESRGQLAEYLHTTPSGLVFVPNATFGVNSVLRSMENRLGPGDEIVITDHGYNACNNAVIVSAAKRNARVVTAQIPFPIDEYGDIVDAILDRVTENTRLLVVDHITSPTGMIMPVAEIVAALEPQVPVLIDGAHAPGMVDVDLGRLGASFYTANCHKWMCAPKGSGFLYVAEPHREWMEAVVISHGHNNGWPGSVARFQAQFDWLGTNDPTAYLTVGTAINVMSEHRDDGWDGIRDSNHELALSGRAIVASVAGVEIPVPDSMVGSIASIPIPIASAPNDGIFEPLMLDLRRKWGIEVPVFTWPDPRQRLLRISAQQYNTEDDYERLAAALQSELG